MLFAVGLATLPCNVSTFALCIIAQVYYYFTFARRFGQFSKNLHILPSLLRHWQGFLLAALSSVANRTNTFLLELDQLSSAHACVEARNARVTFSIAFPNFNFFLSLPEVFFRNHRYRIRISLAQHFQKVKCIQSTCRLFTKSEILEYLTTLSVVTILYVAGLLALAIVRDSSSRT